MQEAVCKKCGRIFPRADVFSWGVCKECDKAKGAAVKKLKYRRTLYGAFSVIATVALGSLLISWWIGPKEYGYYVLLTKSYSTKAHITYDTLWWMTAVVSVSPTMPAWRIAKRGSVALLVRGRNASMSHLRGSDSRYRLVARIVHQKWATVK